MDCRSIWVGCAASRGWGRWWRPRECLVRPGSHGIRRSTGARITSCCLRCGQGHGRRGRSGACRSAVSGRSRSGKRGSRQYGWRMGTAGLRLRLRDGSTFEGRGGETLRASGRDSENPRSCFDKDAASWRRCAAWQVARRVVLSQVSETRPGAPTFVVSREGERLFVVYFGGGGVKISGLRPGSGFGLGLGAFLVSFRPLSLFPMGASLPQLGDGEQWSVGKMVVVEDGVEHEAVRSESFAAVDGVDGEEQHAAFAQVCVHDDGVLCDGSGFIE